MHQPFAFSSFESDLLSPEVVDLSPGDLADVCVPTDQK